MTIKNVVFDIGNVLVRWAPQDVVCALFPEEKHPEALTAKIFKSEIWYDLNLGKVTIAEAIQRYSQLLNISIDKVTYLMHKTQESLLPLPGSFELLDDLYNLNTPLYSITDNIREIMIFLKNKYDFFHKFLGIVVSAEVGVLKPSPVIYRHLIESYALVPEETVFLDDIPQNVQGAESVGLRGILFTTADNCRMQLRRLGVLI